MSLSCSHQIPIGPPPTCSAQGLHCCSVCADFCSSSSYVSVVPGHGPCSKFDTGPAVSLWTCLLIMRMCLTVATAATRGLTLPWWFAYKCHHKMLETSGSLTPQRCKTVACLKRIEVFPQSDFSVPSERKISLKIIKQNITILVSLCTGLFLHIQKILAKIRCLPAYTVFFTCGILHCC